MIKLAGQFVPLRVNYEKEGADLVKMYKVTALPTVLFLDAQGAVWGKIVGYQQPKPYMESMSRVSHVRKNYLNAIQTLRRRPYDGKANAHVARTDAALGRLIEAASAVDRLEAAKYKSKDLAAVYNAVGEGFQDAGELDEAIKYFVKAEAAGKEAKNLNDRSLALISIVDCYASKGDRETAKTYALRLITLEGGTKPYVDRARRFLGSG